MLWTGLIAELTVSKIPQDPHIVTWLCHAEPNLRTYTGIFDIHSKCREFFHGQVCPFFGRNVLWNLSGYIA